MANWDELKQTFFEETKEGLEAIVQLTVGMNPSGKRRYSGSEILNSLRSGERIVCAAGNRGNT